MKKNYAENYPDTPAGLLQKTCLLLFITLAFVFAGCKKGVEPTAAEASPNGQLSRYDLLLSDYDVLPVNTFTFSYNNDGKITNLFQRSGQNLLSFSLQYNGDKLIKSVANNQGVQTIFYNTSGKPARVDYTTLSDTGKLVFNYDAAGKLTGVLDSVKKPLSFAIRYQYLFTYDVTGGNVVKIIKNQLDLQGRATLKQYSFYSFDDKPNPFSGLPYLQSSSTLPGEFAALVNKNNITSAQLVGTILNPSSGGSVPTLDTITVYRALRTYQYNSKGLPFKVDEKFNDIQFNYSGKRSFNYEY
ncbi:hypothetical protein [Mucilaginibacter paludis]|uniref:YD repeat-containing protein n=1 Tax=Mucilaginibacter paludis DSM 18603 TaxID=714943 RepID=H1YGV9_9SPHI|nr:hypothetical protein [Mucilaginibacter paludis]EHQ26388.1 hypothetical protein Mucpa_2255 [Mucilaginibacter paludis DSM 18603]